LTVLIEPEDEYSDAVVERPQLTASALNKDLQMVHDLVISLRLTVSWRGA
jgi:hypothetical protein